LNYSVKNILCLLLLSAVVLGCSTKKNTAVSRAYQNMTSHYNVYFNAKESLKAGLLRIDKTIPDDYTHSLPVYKTSNPLAAKAATSEMELTILKCSKLIALHSISKSPERKSNTSERYKKFASKGEYNKWVDQSYVLMGEASYYNHDYHRAIENFNYVIRKFTDSPSHYIAFLWMARTYIETGDNDKALEIFKMLERDGGFPKNAKKDLNIAQAHYYLKNNQLDEAISHLKTALQSHFPRNENLRYNYLLAQLLASTDKPDEAVQQYRYVLKMRPPHQIAFNARISSMELAGGNNDAIKNQLKKLLADENNTEFRDRIYYAIGQIALKENRKSDALSAFRLSVKNSTTNNSQRALSSLTVARILFEENNYLLSACYYDSVMAVIDNNYPGYQEIMTRAGSLRRLADNLNTISREDSLQRLAKMPEAERNALINSIISKIQQEEAKKLAQANAEASSQNYFRAQQYRPQISVADNQNLWYFYNPSTVGIGKSEFQRIWGKRKLEDDWRRKNKASTITEDAEQMTEAIKAIATPETKKKIADPKSKEYYLQYIPLTDSLRRISTELIKAAFFNAGRSYQTDFNNSLKAIATFEELNRRYPGSIYELPAWFELYQLNKQADNTPQAALYKDKIIKGYPDSKYAKYLLNPAYFAEMEANNAVVEKKYAEAFRFYRASDYNNAKKMATETIALKPDSNLVPKARFIELVSEAPNQDRTDFASALDHYIKAFPKAPTKEIAIQIRNLLKTNALDDYHQLLTKGYVNENIVNNELKPTGNAGKDEFDGKYSYEEDMFHYYIIAFSSEAHVDVSRLIYDLANYNLDYYTSTDFDIEAVNLNPKTQMVVVRSIPDKVEGLIYFRSIIRKRPVFQALKGIEYVNFVASSSNYRKIIEDKDYLDYLKFFMKNYSPYINSQIPADVLPSPMELIAKARKVEEPVEKGKFILLKQEILKDATSKPLNDYKGPYKTEPSKDNLFAMVFQPSEVEGAKLINSFNAFNSANFGGPSIKISVDPLDDFRSILLVSGLGEYPSALAYFKKVVTDQALLASLKNVNYRDFVINAENLTIFKKEKDINQYLDFFNRIK
jgi:tetratricopeptide (TPR) repeat protein